MTAFEAVDLSKNYPLSDSPWGRFRHVFAPGEVRYEQGLWALRGVSFEVEKGEAFGLDLYEHGLPAYPEYVIASGALPVGMLSEEHISEPTPQIDVSKPEPASSIP